MITFDNVHKWYGGAGGDSKSRIRDPGGNRDGNRDGNRGEALRGIGFEIAAGKLVLVAGRSGAGKTTLLKLVAAIEKPNRGVVTVNGQDTGKLKRRAIPSLRRKLGLIFQDQKLLPDRSVFDNVLLPLVVVGTPHRDAARRARAALDKVGLLSREKLGPLALSGGEQQQLAIARAIVNRPAILIADEPTANLDHDAARRVIEIFVQFNQVGVTVLIATHDEALFDGLAPQVVRLEQGRLSDTVADAVRDGALDPAVPKMAAREFP